MATNCGFLIKGFIIGDMVCNIHGQRVLYSLETGLISHCRFGLISGKGLDYIEGEIFKVDQDFVNKFVAEKIFKRKTQEVIDYL